MEIELEEIEQSADGSDFASETRRREAGAVRKMQVLPGH